MAEPVSIGVIGVGPMGSLHARQMAQPDEVYVVAVADIEAEWAQAIGEAIGARVFSGDRDLIRKGDVEAMLIAAPHPRHGHVAAYAARWGYICSRKSS
jgi:predicted dehydrogenase